MFSRWLRPVILAPLILLLGTIAWLQLAPKQNTLPERPSATEAQAPISIGWRQGTTQQYAIESNSSMQMNTDGTGESQHMSVQIEATLDVHTLQTSNQAALVGMQLSTIDLRINNQTDAQANAALMLPFRVRYVSGAYPGEFEFPAKVSVRDRSILENLIRMFQITDSTGANWTATEANGSGTYEANYQRSSSGRIEKTKRQFKAPANQPLFDAAEIDSTETIQLSAGIDWIDSMRVDEKLVTNGQGGPAITILNEASIKRLRALSDPLTADRWRFAAVAADSDKTVKQKAKLELSKEAAHLRILSSVTKLDHTEQGRTTWIHELRDLLRVDDSLPAALLDVLRTQELSDRTRADLYLALELAGTGSAQKALITVMSEQTWAITDALRAIVALGGVEQPKEESITALWQSVYSAADGGDRQRLGSTATFALGNLGRALKDSENERYLALRSDLLNAAMSESNETQRANYVYALGNTGDSSLSEQVAGFLDEDASKIRRAAAQSLEVLGADSVADSLVNQFHQESNSEVRGAIAAALTNWSKPTAQANSLIANAFNNEKRANSRYKMARFLSANLQNFPDNKQLLQEILRHESSKRIRQHVANALAVDATTHSN